MRGNFPQYLDRPGSIRLGRSGTGKDRTGTGHEARCPPVGRVSAVRAGGRSHFWGGIEQPARRGRWRVDYRRPHRPVADKPAPAPSRHVL